jgi:hypothetical protein
MPCALAKARNLFRAGARVTFFGAKKVTKESISKSNSNLPSEAWPGFFDKTSLSCRKTAGLLPAALRVSDSGHGIVTVRLLS